MTLKVTPNAGIQLSVLFDVELIDICMTTSFIDQKIGNLEVIRQSNLYGQINFIKWVEFTTAAAN